MLTKNADKSAVVVQWLLFLLLLMTFQISSVSDISTVNIYIVVWAVTYQYCFFKRESQEPTSDEGSSDQVPTQLQEATSPVVVNFPIKQLQQDGMHKDEAGISPDNVNGIELVVATVQKDAEQISTPLVLADGQGDDDVEANSPQTQEQQGLVAQEPDPASPLVGKKKKPRLIFLDNVKTFLTAMVVFHHCSCAFGACDQTAMPLVIGLNSARTVAKKVLMDSVIIINSVYFMPLFFFISAYFVPSSYKKKGGAAFRLGRRKRILYPALFLLLIWSPGLYAIGQYVGRQHNPENFATAVSYSMGNAGPGWFLFWLLLLNWVYTSIVEASPSSSGENKEQMPFPGTMKRMAYGIALGLILRFSETLLRPTPAMGMFAMMPLGPGSFMIQMFMFYLGFVAKKNGWLEKDLTEQLDISLPLHLCFVLVEYAALFALDGRMYSPAYPSFLSNFWVISATLVIGSMLTLDMSLAVLMVFQKWFNRENNFTKKLARSAYAVYIIHVAIILPLQLVFIAIYKDDMVFSDVISGSYGSPVGEGLNKGLNINYAGGYVVVSIAAQLVVWPVSYALTRLPYFRDII